MSVEYMVKSATIRASEMTLGIYCVNHQEPPPFGYDLEENGYQVIFADKTRTWLSEEVFKLMYSRGQ